MKPGKKPFKRKVCPACGVNKLRSQYYKKGATVSYRCKPCSLIESKAKAARYFGKYSEYQNKWRQDRYSKDPKYRKKISRQKKASYAKRKDAANTARRERWANDPFNPARLYHRRKDVKGRTPHWVSKDELLFVYANCPRQKVVDHIIPLKGLIDGRPVSGLHVPWNLQYLTEAANRKKYNRITEKDISHLC